MCKLKEVDTQADLAEVSLSSASRWSKFMPGHWQAPLDFARRVG
jgi:hypothetical protein